MGRLPRILGAAMGTAARRPLAVGLLVTVLALAGAALALRLSPTTASKTLVGSSSLSYQATEREHQLFGEDAVYVLVRGDVSKLVLTSDLERLIALEGCLGGNVPKGATPVGGWAGPCGRLGKTKPVKVVFGPGTFINESVRQIGDQYNAQLASIKAVSEKQYNAAYKLARGKGYTKAKSKSLATAGREPRQLPVGERAIKLALKYGLLKAPQVNDPGFVSQLVFAGGKAAGTPKARFAYLFPNANSSLIQVRLKPGLSDSARKDAIAQIRAATNLQPLRLLSGGQYVVTGAPVVLSDLTTKITEAIVTLLIASVLVMALVLAVVFRARRRLLPLVVALSAVAITFGVLSAIGASLTMASVGVVPVLIGLAVDYAIQLHARIEERAGRGPPVPRSSPPSPTSRRRARPRSRSPPPPPPRASSCSAAHRCRWSAASACCWSAASSSPWRPPSRWAPPRSSAHRRPAPSCARSRGRRRRAGRRGRARRRRAAGRQPRRPRDRRARPCGPLGSAWRGGPRQRVLAIGLAIAVVGWVADTQTKVESDVTKLVPQTSRRWPICRRCRSPRALAARSTFWSAAISSHRPR